jgi:uncharacterized membrane protein
MAEGTGRGERFSIWFFVGIMTLSYGLALVPWGIYEWSHPPANEIALGWLVKYHPTFWWGLLLLLFGTFYTVKFRPRGGDSNAA